MFLYMKILSVLMNVLVFRSTRASKSQWVIICEIGDVGNFGNLSGSFVTFSSLITDLLFQMCSRYS